MKQNSFFPSRYDIFQEQNPDKVKKKKSSGSRTKKKTSSKPVAPKIYNCETCGRSSVCRHPKMKRYGDGKSGIMFVGDYPRIEEDLVGVPFVGAAGDLLRRHCQYLDLDFDVDCVSTNAVVCCASGAPTSEQVIACQKNLERDIQEVRPKLIVCLGDTAINAVLDKPVACKFPRFTAGMVHGIVVPSQKYNCWVVCCYHPNYTLRRMHNPNAPNDENILLFDIAKGLSHIDKPLPKPLTTDNNFMLTTVDEVEAVLELMIADKRPFAYDYETTCVSPYNQDAELLSIAFTNDVDSGYFIPLNFKNENGEYYFTSGEVHTILKMFRAVLECENVPKVVQNLNMEEIWNLEVVKTKTINFHHDTMIGAHVLHCQPSTTGLAFQVFELCGHDYKGMVDTEDLRNASVDKVFHYNTWDARYTLWSYCNQRECLEQEGRLSEFNGLLQRGAQALATMKHRGVQISKIDLESIEKKYEQEKLLRETQMASYPGVKEYLENNGKVFNPESNPQLGSMLYKHYQVPIYKKTATTHKTGIGSTDAEALEIIKNKCDISEVKNLISDLFRFRKCTTLLRRATNYRNVMDKSWVVHPSYNLNMADTYRSSANDPNIQNVFKHDDELIVFRKCIVPTPGRILLDVDYSGLEVRVIAMVSQDKELTKQIIEGVDTHLKWATELFQISESRALEGTFRFDAKNRFVFASFYGATAESVARRFPTISDNHIFATQKKFWEQYSDAKEWQQRIIHTYEQYGYVEGASGFRRPGPIDINKVCNTPIQGSAFHLLLDALPRIEAELEKRKLQTRPIFEIHDSIAFDTVPEEAGEVVDVVGGILCSKRFDWQGDVPLEVSWEIGVHDWWDMGKLRMAECAVCGKCGPQSVSTVKRKGAQGEEDHMYERATCGLCRQTSEVRLK